MVWRAIPCVVAALCLSTSCSMYMGISHLGHDYRAPTDCRWYYGAAVIDLVMTAAETAAVSVDVASSSTYDCSTSATEPKQCSKIWWFSAPAIFAISSLWGYQQGHECTQQFEPPNAREIAILRKRELATLMQRSAASAHAGDCASVRIAGAQVLKLDADFYGTVFVRDAAIERCLMTAPAPGT